MLSSHAISTMLYCYVDFKTFARRLVTQSFNESTIVKTMMIIKLLKACGRLFKNSDEL